MTTLTHGKYYAMKRVSKKQIVAKRQEEHMLFEKKILKAIQCDFIVKYLLTSGIFSKRHIPADSIQYLKIFSFFYILDFMLLSKTQGISTW